MYSLGVVVHAIFNEGKPVFQVNKHDIFKSFSRQLDQVSGGVRNVEAQHVAGLTHSSVNLLQQLIKQANVLARFDWKNQRMFEMTCSITVS